MSVTIKYKTVPEILDVLNAMLNHVLNQRDRATVAVLAEQRTFTRAEKQLIDGLCRKYNLTQSFVDANHI